MGLTIVSEPTSLLPAYTPLKFKLKTDRLPNTIAGESAITIATIGLPTAGELATYATLRSTDLVVRHGVVAPLTFAVGQSVLISGTILGKYDGRHTVIKEVATDLIVIDSTYIGPATTGTIGKYYDGLKCFAVVTLSNGGMDTFPATKAHELTPNSLGEIEFDIRSILQRAMSLELDDPTAFATVERCRHFIRHQVKFYEGFLEPFAGVTVYTIEDLIFVESNERTAIMAAQPYAHGLTGQVYTYADMLDPFKVLATADARFLTHRPRGEYFSIGREEHHRLDFMVGKIKDAETALEVRILAKNSGTTVADNTIPFTSIGHSTYYVTCGPGDMTPIQIPATANEYWVYIQLAGGIAITEIMKYRIDPRICEGPQYTVFWRNKLGGLDSFFFGGSMSVSGQSESIITQRDELNDYEDGDVAALREVRARKSYQVHTLLTDNVSAEVQGWLASELCQSIQAFILDPAIDGYIPIIIENGEAPSYGVNGQRARFSLTYRMANETPHHIR